MHQPCLSFPINYLRPPPLRWQRCQPALLTPSGLRELPPTEPITQGFVKSPCSAAQRSHLGTEDEARTRLSLVAAAAAWRVCRSCRPQVTPSPRWSPACPRHRDRIDPAVWELGWEELGQHHHPGPPTGVKGQPDPLKSHQRTQAQTPAGHQCQARWQLCHGATVPDGSWHRATAWPPIMCVPPRPPAALPLCTRGGLRPNSCPGFSPGCAPRSTLWDRAGGTSHASSTARWEVSCRLSRSGHFTAKT